MSCLHKFHEYLSLKDLGYAPETLIVGTFEPGGVADNEAEWFYGRTADVCLWDVLPRLYGHDSLSHATPAEWRQFCHDNKIAFTDLISDIDDADPGSPKDSRILRSFSDEAFAHNYEDFTFTDVVAILKRHPSIKNVYLTRGITEAFWRHLWNSVIGYCGREGIHERRLTPPSLKERYQYEKYNNEHRGAPIARLEDYILMKWREEWHSGR